MVVYAKAGEPSRLAFAIGRRAVPSSVRRNRLRRVARERFRQLELSGFDVVLVAFRGAKNTQQVTLEKQIERIFSALGKQCAD